MTARFVALLLGALASAACSSAKPETAPAPPGAGASNAPAGDSTRDAGADADADADDGGDAYVNYAACYPQLPTEGFTPVTVTPLVNKICTSTQIATFVQTCLIGADGGSCSAWSEDPANTACFHDCLVSPYQATAAEAGTAQTSPMASLGPIIDTQNPGLATWFNLSACIGLADPTQASCAKQLSDRFQCEMAACTATCTVGTTSNPNVTREETFDLQNCAQQADFSACSTYATGACVLSTPDAGPSAFCYELASGNEGALTQLVTQQCGI